MRVALGAVIWTAIIVLVIRWMGTSPDPELSPSGMIMRYVTSDRQEVRLFLEPPQVVSIGDPIFVSGSANDPPIGRIVRVIDPQNRKFRTGQLIFADSIVVELNGGWKKELNVPDSGALRFTFHQTPKSMAWVVKTMLPDSKRREIAGIIMETVKEHQKDIARALQPLLLESLRESELVIREDFRRAIDARRDEIQVLVGKYQVDIVQEKLVPLFRDEIWPIIEEEGLPVITEIGQEIWQQASIWRLSWRYLYDVSPLPQRDLTKQEFQRLVNEEISPLITVWLPEIYAVQKRIFQRMGQNERVKQTATEVMTTLANDPDLQSIIIDVLQDVLADNPRLAAVWKEIWNSPEARQSLDDMNRRMEPSITDIGEAMFGNPRTKITPEFSTVLRNKVLFKDERWFTVSAVVSDEEYPKRTPNDELIVYPATVPADNPFHVPARSRN